MRVLNGESLCSHGNKPARNHLLQIIEAGLEAADPYRNVRQLVRVDGNHLIVGDPLFEPRGTPHPGGRVFDLSVVGNIYVVGAGKGIQRMAKGIEDALGDRLTGGHVIDKHGADVILGRIGVTMGAHPVPDEGCILGCQRILALLKGLRKDDLVFTLAANGVSALLTLPVPGISLEEVRRVTYLMQIDRGAPTEDLNHIRNHVDVMKGGRISRYLQPATAIHLVGEDPGGSCGSSLGFEWFMTQNLWLHTLPDCTSFEGAVAALKKWDAWEDAPASVKEHLLRADPSQESVRPREFWSWDSLVYGVMPREIGMVPAARAKAAELGYTPYTLSSWFQAEAGHAGVVISRIAQSVERDGVPFEPPCALFTTGEMLVTVGKEDGIGGRNQEFALGAALTIAGSENIVMASVDSDGTDGPGTQFNSKGEPVPTLAGGMVDGHTIAEAAEAEVDLRAELRRHNTTPALWKLNCGVKTTYSLSMVDLGVTLVTGRKEAGERTDSCQSPDQL